MKVALVHDWLDSRIGGAEEVFLEIAKLYPDADIFTLLYKPKTYRHLLAGRKITVSYLRFFPGFVRKRLAFLLPFIPGAVRSHDLRGYDLVISDSSAWSKNVRIPKGVTHICYCHSPARMLWDSWPKYLDQFPIARHKIVRLYLARLVSKIRLWDFYASDGVDYFIANSHYIAGRIKKYYGRDARVIYPPVHVPNMTPEVKTDKKPYWLILSTLARYKNIDVVIEAFKISGRDLVIAGDGSARAYLKEKAEAAHNISLVGRVEESRKWELLAGAEALMFANIEDFGITPVEAHAVATPVIALRGGGLNETMLDGKTAILFDELSAQAINAAIDRSTKHHFDDAVLKNNAKKYRTEIFQKEFNEFIHDHS